MKLLKNAWLTGSPQLSTPSVSQGHSHLKAQCTDAVGAETEVLLQGLAQWFSDQVYASPLTLRNSFLVEATIPNLEAGSSCKQELLPGLLLSCWVEDHLTPCRPGIKHNTGGDRAEKADPLYLQ